VDRAGLVTLVIYTITMLLRSIEPFITERRSPTFGLMNSVVQTLIWNAIYYFTFEMRLIYLTIVSDNKSEFFIKLPKLASLRLIVMLVLTLIYLPLMGAQSFIQVGWNDFYNNNQKYFFIFLGIMRALKVTGDAIIIYMFISSIKLFIKLKLQSMKAKE
jgi:hypothetical protein